MVFQGYGGAARLCKRCMLAKVELVVLLRSLSSVPLIFWPLPDTESTYFVELVSLLMPLFFSGAIALLFLSCL